MSDEEIMYTLRAMRSCIIKRKEHGCTKQCEKCFYYLEMGDLEQQEKALHTAIQTFYEETFEK